MTSAAFSGRSAVRWVAAAVMVVLAATVGGCVPGAGKAGPTPGAVDESYARKVVSDEIGALALDVDMTNYDLATVAADADAIVATHATPGSADICARVSDLSVDVIVVYGDAQGFEGDLDAFRDDVRLIRGDHAGEAAEAISAVDAHIDVINSDTAAAYADGLRAAAAAGCPGPDPAPTPLSHVAA